MSLDDIEAEILYTRAAMRADPDAKDLVPMTDTWLTMLDDTRKKQRTASEAGVNADAFRSVSNARLDAACMAFASELDDALKQDHSSARYKQFFNTPASRFVRQSLTTQVNVVKGWLDNANDDVLKRHRPLLERWSTAAMNAIEATSATALVRGQAWIAREKLAEDLTRERDRVYHALMGKTQQLNLSRDWPNVFFRTATTSQRKHNTETMTDNSDNADDKLRDNSVNEG
jgi:hypothetical protein